MVLRRRNYLIIFFLFFSLMCSAQEPVSAMLEKHFSRLRENLPSARKLIITDSVRQILEPYAVSDSVFRHRFNNLRFLGQITSPDSLLKILTWNLILNEGVNRYFCYLIYRPDNDAPPRAFYLTGEYKEQPPDEELVYDTKNWYGAIYYDVRPFICKGRKCYTLLAIDYGNSFITRKIIDVLKFDNEGNLLFGENCFTDGKKTTGRVLFEYSATAVMSLKFEADTLIVFDHLSPFSPELKNNRQYYGPDFSFDAYYLKNGLWTLKEDIDIRNRRK